MHVLLLAVSKTISKYRVAVVFSTSKLNLLEASVWHHYIHVPPPYHIGARWYIIYLFVLLLVSLSHRTFATLMRAMPYLVITRLFNSPIV